MTTPTNQSTQLSNNTVQVFKQNKIGRAFYDKYGFKLIKEYFHEESKQDLLRLKFSH